MGREWYLNWGTKSSSKKRGMTGGGGGGRERKRAAPPAAAATMAATAGGCMNAVLHMFDFHHFQLCLHPHDSAAVLSHHDPTSLKVNSGVEAPRNSLESLEKMVIGPPSLASIIEDEKNNASSHIPPGVRRDTKLKLVQAPRPKIEPELSSESSSCSPGGARTPNLVARLMGLDILPDSTTTTPRSSSSQPPLRSPHVSSSSTPLSRSKKTTRTRTRPHDENNVTGPHSLPETPRSSSPSISRRRSTDQINKENSIVKEMESSRPSCSAISTKRIKEGRSYEEECRSPGYYARQIMKQVKETVSRRVGVDITNTVAHRRDEHLLSTQSSKPKKSNKKDSIPCKNSSMEVSKPTEEKENDELHCSNKLLLEKDLKKYFGSSSNNNNKSCSKKPPLNSIRNKKEEQFVRPPVNKKRKKTPLSTDLLHGSVPASLVPLKKDSHSTTTKFLHKQSQRESSKVQPLKGSTTSINSGTSISTTAQLSRILSQRYERLQEKATHTSVGQRDQRSIKDTTTSSAAEFQYISRILKCTGIDRDTPVSFTRWFSPSHPLDPSIFHNLEASHYHLTPSDSSSPRTQIGLAFNRKLIFHLVDEILADILKPYIKFKPWVPSPWGQNGHYHHQQQQQQQINGFQLVKTLCTRIRSFPSTNCETLQDIDALVEKDLPNFGAQSDLVALEEEGETIVTEIEGDILDSLVQEIAVLCLGSRCSSMQRHVTNISRPIIHNV